MSKDRKSPDLQTIARQFLGRKIDWVDAGSPLHNRTYLEAVGEQMAPVDAPFSSMDNLIHSLLEEIVQPQIDLLAARISDDAPELAGALKGVNAYDYAENPNKVNKALTRFLRDKPWHDAAENVLFLHKVLERWRNEFLTPLDEAQRMMTRFRHISQISPSTSLNSSSLDRIVSTGIAGLDTLANGFLTMKNDLQAIPNEGTTRVIIEKALSDADDALKTIAADARKMQAAIGQARAAQKQSPPPPPFS